MDRSARRGGVGDRLLKRVDHSGVDRPAVAHVNEERNLARGGQAEQAEDFGARFVRQVGDAQSDAGRAFVEAAAHAVQDLAEFLRRGGALHRAVARQQRAAIVHHRDARGNIAAGGAEVDQRASLALRVPGRYGVDAHLEFQRRGDAVARLETVVLRRLPVRMQVDKSGRHHQALGVDRGAPPSSGVAETAAILPPRMPMWRTASRLLAGSSTRPLAITRS